MMRHLPDELILQIIAYLEPVELVSLQLVSRQFLRLARDSNLWRTLCFEHSAAERKRRRLLPAPDDLDPRLAELIRAANEVASVVPAAANADPQAQKHRARRKAALLANWDPTYPGETVDFYQEFVQRHAPHTISWFQHAKHGHRDDHLHHEATGAGILYGDDGLADKLVAPLEDGSISIWEACAGNEGWGRIVARTAMGLLPNKGNDLDNDTRLAQSRAAMTETGAVECVSIDSRQKKAFFAVQNTFNEVDLHTLQVVARTPYPFAITALSEAHHPTPLTVGTNWTVHLHDTRMPPSLPASSRCELIGGASPTPASLSRLETGAFGGHVSLAQPGALSILHLPTAREWDGNGDIWLAGRFTSLLNFDRRFFPRLRGTVHSGARLSCLAALPYPFISRPRSASVDGMKSSTTSGHTLIAAGEYKGKGSLELYGLGSDLYRRIDSSDARTTRNAHACYQNRQTASASKLLSVAPHGTRIVFADGDGNMKWVERDASSVVRQFNVNTHTAPVIPSGSLGSTSRSASRSCGESEDAHVNPASASPSPNHWDESMVQKILPTVSPSLHAAPHARTAPVPLDQDNLVIWTGDGRLGLVSFGAGACFDGDDVVDRAVEEALRQSDRGIVGERERERERAFAGEMRKALEMQARESRWLRGYGL